MVVIPHQRHFQYRHPTFGTNARPKPSAAWTKTMYYLWWEFLRRSEPYRTTCDHGGVGQLSALYESFGDVHETAFKQWWSEASRGLRLFAEPRGHDSVRIVEKAEDLSLNSSTLTISLPLYLPRNFLLKRARELIKSRHSGRSGIQHSRNSAARFRVSGKPNVAALTLALKVFDYRMANPELPLWAIGNTLSGFQMEQKIKVDDSAAIRVNKKNVLAATVSRYLRRAKMTISAVERGEFPGRSTAPTIT